MFLRSGPASAEDSTSAQLRLNADIQYLTVDAAREGRSVGRRGLQMAAEYIGAKFGEGGLVTTSYGGTPFQEFIGAMIVKMGLHNNLTLVGPVDEAGTPKRTELVLGRDYIPLAIGGSGNLDCPLVFASYGRFDPEKQFDEYQGLDLAGKAPIMLMGFDRPDVCKIPYQERMAKPRDLKAGALILVRNASLTQKDLTVYQQEWEKSLQRLSKDLAAFKELSRPTPEQIESHMQQLGDATKNILVWQERQRDVRELQMGFDSVGWEEVDPGYPIVRFARSVFDRILKFSAGIGLCDLERRIDDENSPHSMALEGWSVTGDVEVRRHALEAKNVVAVLEGAGALADDTIVFGAHYDVLPEIPEAPMPCQPPHDYPTFLGESCEGALVGSSPQAISQGANDNASGVVVLLEVARSMAKLKKSPRRRIVFIAFAGEELGMVGSKSYVRRPLFPIEKTVAMINIDMVGRLANDKLVAIGAAPPGHFGKLLDNTNEQYGFQIDKTVVNPWSGDQAPFHAKRIPTIWLGTGPDETINTPEDRSERLNVNGMLRIASFLTEFLTSVATDDESPEFVEANN